MISWHAGEDRTGPPNAKVDQMAHFAKYASVTPDTPLSRVETKSSDGDDPEEDEEHEHHELRLLERRLRLCRREQQVTSLLESKVDQMTHFAKYASVTPDTPPSRVEAKFPDGDYFEEDEEHEHDELRLLERRLGLRRRERMQGRHATKSHDDEDDRMAARSHSRGTARR